MMSLEESREQRVHRRARSSEEGDRRGGGSGAIGRKEETVRKIKGVKYNKLRKNGEK